MELVSLDGVARAPHLFMAIVIVPPGWKIESNRMTELENANDVLVK